MADELRALAAAATPGPWFFDGYSAVGATAKGRRYDDIEFPECVVPAWKTSCDEPRGSCHGCPFFELDYRESPVVAFVQPHHGDTATGQRSADAEFIAAVSPDIVVGLLDEIDRLRAVIDDARAEGEPVGTYGCAWCGVEGSHKPDCAWLKIEAEARRA